MSGPVLQPLDAYQGDEFIQVNSLTNVTTDQIAEAWFTVKRKEVVGEDTDDTDATTQVTLSGGGIVVLNSTDIQVTVAASETKNWTRATYVYDIQIRTLAGKKYTLTYGPLVVQFDVTKSI